jgi:hypothetical protein
VLHWSFVAVVVVSLSTGLRIASDYAGSVAGSLGRRLLWLLPEGGVIEWHVVSSLVLTFIAVAYGLFLWRSRLAGRVALRIVDLRRLRPASDSDGTATGAAAWSVINRGLFQVAFVLVQVLALTGWMMYNQTYLGVSMAWIATLHGIAACGIIGYVALHVIAVAKARVFWKMFRPRARHGVAGAAAVLVAGPVLGATYFTHGMVGPTLIVPRVDAAPELTGLGDHPAWAASRTLRIHTARGANLPRGEVTVEVSAVHDGEFVYFAFRWDDPQRSQKMTPLLKTEQGWRVLQSALETNDENEYYEDKFAVMLSHRPALGSGTTHLGQDLISGPHYRNPRGLHYTEDGGVVDLWHWKSVRSGGMSPGYIDDNYVGPPLPPVAPGARYTGGYTQDSTGLPSPYLQNWTKLDSQLPLDQTSVVPLYLPRERGVLERAGTIDLDPEAQDDGVWFLKLDEALPYEPALDDYPVGAVLPGIVLTGPFEGDRAHVPAEARWSNGRWTLEARRLIDTGSRYDVSFEFDQDVFLWVGVFNHAQTRHSQHLHPVRVVLER